MSYGEEIHIDGYRLLRKCGCGATGEVWMVEDMAGRRLAMKLFELDDYGDCEFSGLKAYVALPPNDHLLAIHHIGRTEKFRYYTMDLADNLSNVEGEYIPATLHKRMVGGYAPGALETAGLGLKIL